MPKKQNDKLAGARGKRKQPSGALNLEPSLDQDYTPISDAASGLARRIEHARVRGTPAGCDPEGQVHGGGHARRAVRGAEAPGRYQTQAEQPRREFGRQVGQRNALVT
ncbi:MAG: hypothetical protein KatS3mg087_0663 [Patescibacteria group bacterium]|nr:MAG: hypothetical protein KatS3mg087_0663 [Patescibacteria group bacterium]